MKRLTMFLVLAFVAGLFATAARADIFQWTTDGTVTGINNNRLHFADVTSPLSTDVQPGGTYTINLGSFDLDNTLDNDSGNFALTVTFSQPPGAQDPSFPNAPVTIDGGAWFIFWLEEATARIDLNNDVRHLTFNGGGFDFQILEDVINVGAWDNPAVLHGQISNFHLDGAPVPEPGSMVLFGTLLSGVFLYLRKKRA